MHILIHMLVYMYTHTHKRVWTTDWGWSILTGDHGCIKAHCNCFAGNRGDYGNVSLVHGSYL